MPPCMWGVLLLFNSFVLVIMVTFLPSSAAVNAAVAPASPVPMTNISVYFASTT